MHEVGDIEGRRFERFDVDCRVRVTRKRFGDASVHYGRASNISIGGMMLIIPLELLGGEVVGLEFNMPHMSHVLRLQAIVRRQLSAYSYGIEFRDLDDQTRQSIIRMCETLSVL